MTAETSAGTAGAVSQTLDRGLRALELLAEADSPLTMAEFASGLSVHRSNAYRILRTLEQRRFVVRDSAGRIALGPKMTVLSRGVAPALHTAATPAINEVARTLGMTAFIGVLDGDQVVTLVAVEPSNVPATIARNPGVHHSFERGAPGHAIESSLSAEERTAWLGSPVFTPAAEEAKRLGHSRSYSEVMEGVFGVAVPLRLVNLPPASVAVVHFSLPDPIDPVIAALQHAVDQITRSYR